MLTGAIVAQCVELVSRWGLQISQLLCRTDDLELEPCPPVDVLREPAGELTVEQAFRLPVREELDHT